MQIMLTSIENLNWFLWSENFDFVLVCKKMKKKKPRKVGIFPLLIRYVWKIDYYNLILIEVDICLSDDWIRRKHKLLLTLILMIFLFFLNFSFFFRNIWKHSIYGIFYIFSFWFFISEIHVFSLISVNI